MGPISPKIKAHQHDELWRPDPPETTERITLQKSGPLISRPPAKAGIVKTKAGENEKKFHSKEAKLVHAKERNSPIRYSCCCCQRLFVLHREPEMMQKTAEIATARNTSIRSKRVDWLDFIMILNRGRVINLRLAVREPNVQPPF
jgi:hypothetical protein